MLPETEPLEPLALNLPLMSPRGACAVIEVLDSIVAQLARANATTISTSSLSAISASYSPDAEPAPRPHPPLASRPAAAAPRAAR